MKPGILVIERDDFPDAWARAVRYLMNHGFPSNGAREAITTIRLYGNAINQVINHTVHPHYPFGKLAINEYCKEFTYEYLDDYVDKPEDEKFSYLYFERFARYPTEVDQIRSTRGALERTSDSRQIQMITYIPSVDATSANPPCLQRIQTRQVGMGLVDLHYMFRSWNVYGAMPSNIIALTEMMNKYILKNDYTINSITINAVSGHVYDSDSSEAKKIGL